MAMHDLIARCSSSFVPRGLHLELAKRGTYLVVFCHVVCTAFSTDIVVGGEVGWAQTDKFDDIDALKGDRLVFDWEGDQRNVVTLQKRSCSNVMNGVEIARPTDSPAVFSLNDTGTFFFSSSLGDQCTAGSLFAVAVTLGNATAEDVKKQHQEERAGDFRDLIRDGDGYCLQPVTDARDSTLMHATCYSPPMQLKPGQVEDALYFLPNPYPENQMVGVTKQTLAIVDDSNRQVPLSELYLHHIFGPSDLVTGEGAEFRGGNDNPQLVEPYHTVVNGSHFVSNLSRLVNIHVINTLGVAPEDVPRCIECWCSDERHAMKGKHGGGSCCSESLCPSSVPSTAINTYHLQLNISYRTLEPSRPVIPVISYMMDANNGSIEYDVVRQAGQHTSVLSQSGPIDAMCPQTSSFGILRCLGHQHIGGQCMRLTNQDTGEELCSSCPTYGLSASREAVGDEHGYLVAMSQTVMEEPKQILPGTIVTIESVYDSSLDHFGVMALFFLDLVDFDTSCPGPVTATTGSAFGPDYAHHQGTAFGIYTSGFAPDSDTELQADPGDTLGIDETADPKLAPTNTSNGVFFPAVVLMGSLVIFAAAGMFAWTLKSRRQKYAPLGQSDLTEEITDNYRSQRISTEL